jgi:hypothetical protein
MSKQIQITSVNRFLTPSSGVAVDPFQTEKYAMPGTKSAFVFVHGGFVCKSIWRLVIPLLEARGHVARALDLPG